MDSVRNTTIQVRFCLFCFSMYTSNFDLDSLGVMNICPVNIHNFFEISKCDFLKFGSWEHVNGGVTFLGVKPGFIHQIPHRVG